MAPTPGTFGAWSCQPANDDAADLASFENRVNAVAANEMGHDMSEHAVAYAG